MRIVGLISVLTVIFDIMSILFVFAVADLFDQSLNRLMTADGRRFSKSAASLGPLQGEFRNIERHLACFVADHDFETGEPQNAARCIFANAFAAPFLVVLHDVMGENGGDASEGVGYDASERQPLLPLEMINRALDSGFQTDKQQENGICVLTSRS
jgi:hypothetical protein